MTARRRFRPEGVIPATIVAFDEDFAIDEEETRRHLRDVAAVDGISAITVNGHSSEVHALGFDEQRRLLELTADAVGDIVPIVAGVYADGSLEAARIAKMAERSGAAALLVFPPNTLLMGGHLRPEMALTHVSTIAAATDLPLIVFNYAAWTNLHYGFDTLLRMAEEVPSVVAVKDWVGEPAQHQRNIAALTALPRPVSVLTTHSAWLLQSLLMGPAGLLSGSGSVIPDLHVALWNAVRAEDLAAAQAAERRIRPTAEAFYAPPFLDMHNRMKEALVLLGRQRRAVVRPPLCKLGDGELQAIRAALVAAGLLDAAGDVTRSAA